MAVAEELKVASLNEVAKSGKANSSNSGDEWSVKNLNLHTKADFDAFTNAFAAGLIRFADDKYFPQFVENVCKKLSGMLTNPTDIKKISTTLNQLSTIRANEQKSKPAAGPKKKPTLNVAVKKGGRSAIDVNEYDNDFGNDDDFYD